MSNIIDNNKGHWEDELGFIWILNMRDSTTYPNGKPDLIVLESSCGARTWLRFNEVGQPIGGNLSIKFIEGRPQKR